MQLNKCKMNKFDIQLIGGMQYNVESNLLNEVVTIKVIKAELIYEIMRAHTLLLDDPKCKANHLVELFTGFYHTPYDITWHVTTNPKESDSIAVMKAVKDGNNIVIVEVIPNEIDK